MTFTDIQQSPQRGAFPNRSQQNDSASGADAARTQSENPDRPPELESGPSDKRTPDKAARPVAETEGSHEADNTAVVATAPKASSREDSMFSLSSLEDDESLSEAEIRDASVRRPEPVTQKDLLAMAKFVVHTTDAGVINVVRSRGYWKAFALQSEVRLSTSRCRARYR